MQRDTLPSDREMYRCMGEGPVTGAVPKDQGTSVMSCHCDCDNVRGRPDKELVRGKKSQLDQIWYNIVAWPQSSGCR